MAVRIASLLKFFEQLAAIKMVADQEQHQRQFDVQPYARVAVTQPQPNAEQQRQRADGCHETVQLARHQQQARMLFFARNHGQIDENARQVKQACKPTGDEDYVKRFNPEH